MYEGAHREGMSRTPLLTAVVAIVVVAIMSGGFVAAAQGVGLPISGTPSGSAHPASDATPAGTALLQKAVANLNAGAARSGSTATCAVSSGTAATCGGSAPRDITNVGRQCPEGPCRRDGLARSYTDAFGNRPIVVQCHDERGEGIGWSGPRNRVRRADGV